MMLYQKDPVIELLKRINHNSWLPEHQKHQVEAQKCVALKADSVTISLCSWRNYKVFFIRGVNCERVLHV